MNENTTFDSSASRVDGTRQDVIAQLVTQAGRRESPSKAAELQTYQAVHAAWQSEQGGRSWQRPAAIAATVLLSVALGFWAWNTQVGSTASSVMAEVRGHVMSIDGTGQEQPIAIGATLTNGEELLTASGGKALMRRSTGLTVLLGPATRVKWEGPNALRLMSGILYVDSGTDGRRDELAVLTSAGRIHHVGTQFSVDARTAEVRVAVREGVVRVNTAKGEVSLAHDQELRIAEGGELKQRDLVSGAGAWSWLAAENPEFAIENRPLFDVVQDIAATSGLSVRFATPEAEHQAQQLILHGPVLRLEPTAALDAVLLTTQMRSSRVANDAGSIEIAAQP